MGKIQCAVFLYVIVLRLFIAGWLNIEFVILAEFLGLV
jgi:hypothetical protein